MKISMEVIKEVDVKKIIVKAGVRYWEDCMVNDLDYNEEANPDFTKIPCKENDIWNPIIDVDNGIILNWNQGTKLKTWFKVCDCCEFSLLDAEGNTVYSRDGYVPNFLDIDDSGYGDYIYLTIDENGKILNWTKDLVEEFLAELEDED